MSRQTFIEKRAEQLAKAGVHLDVGDSTVSADPTDDLDYNVETVEVEDKVLNQKRKIGVETISPNNTQILWVKVRNYSNAYQPRTVPDTMVDICLKKKDQWGNKAFWRQEHLPANWVPFTTDNFELECFEEACHKRLPSAQSLAAHMQGFHPDTYELFKDEIVELVKEYAKERSAARNKNKGNIAKDNAAAA